MTSDRYDLIVDPGDDATSLRVRIFRVDHLEEGEVFSDLMVEVGHMDLNLLWLAKVIGQAMDRAETYRQDATRTPDEAAQVAAVDKEERAHRERVEREAHP